MIHPLLCLCATLAAAPNAALELQYRGTVEPATRGAAAAPTKTFDLYCLLAGDAASRQVTFLVDERGAGGWAWPERFGRLPVAGSAETPGASIQLLHEHDGSQYPIPVDGPVFAQAERLTDDARWESGGLGYEVTGTAKRADRACWVVSVSGKVGKSGMLWVEKETGYLVAAERRVVMGRGDEFRLTMELQSAEEVDEERAERLRGVGDQLAELQRRLGRKEGETSPELTPEQLQSAEGSLEKFAKEAEGTPFGRLVAAAGRDVQSQAQRGEDVDALAKKYVGEAAPELALVGLDGREIPANEREGKVVVLHFWKYHGEPLAEPYGQVGYLDFLNNRRQKLGVQTYGVAVDPRLGAEPTRGAAVRQVRKLQEFFNLGYTIAADDGTLLKKFGDPQRLGASLPLWVVIGPDGKVAHYKVGTYDIKPEEGLRPLDEVVAELIRKQRGAQP